jgi:hypothetical protein
MSPKLNPRAKEAAKKVAGEAGGVVREVASEAGGVVREARGTVREATGVVSEVKKNVRWVILGLLFILLVAVLGSIFILSQACGVLESLIPN